MLLANPPHRKAVHADPGATTSMLTTACQAFWASDRDVGTPGVGDETPTLHIKLYRNRHYADGTMKLLNGAMVGGLENTNATTNSIAYPQLGPLGMGCVFFKRRSSTSSSADAWFHPLGSGDPVKFGHAVYCKHDGDKKPIWTSVPPGCEKMELTTDNVSVTVTAPQGQLVFAQSAALDALEQALVRKGLARARAAAIRKALSGYGAWYPCDAAGCCRAV